MSRDPFLHKLDDFPDLIQIVADERDIVPQLVEKDYWIMHCLFGLSLQGFKFELKGGTSLSKGFSIIQRFSEDIDIKIFPDVAPFKVYSGKNQDKSAHIDSRKQFYDWLAGCISIEGIIRTERDIAFDDEKYRSGGIRLYYDSILETLPGLKDGILLEVGFDDTMPNVALTISSWAFDKAFESEVGIIDNRAVNVKCYHAGYTFVEKLQTVSTKFRKQQTSGVLPTNFLRHYYDISKLLEHPDVQTFIGTDTYYERKRKRFRSDDNQNIAENEAFLMSDTEVRKQFRDAFKTTASLYFGEQPDFDDILSKIQSQIQQL